jgi:4-hydroxy-tetrahydrodipicolinate synthase
MRKPIQLRAKRLTLAGIGGSLAALPSPFQGDQIDHTALARLAERQITCGVSGLVVCGSTGEAGALTQDEYEQIVRVVVGIADGRVPVIAGCTSATTTANSIALAGAAVSAGADALLCAAPPYCKPTQQGIVTHIGALAQACGLPVILYDVPGRVGVAIADATVACLFADGLIVGIKDATADLSRPTRLRALCGNHLLQLSGDDATQLAYRAMGGHGCISVTANIVPGLCALLHRAWDAGDFTSVASLRDYLAPLHAALFTESNPIPLKAALAELEMCGAEVRAPLTHAEPATVERLRHALQSIIPLEQALASARPNSEVCLCERSLEPCNVDVSFIM